jgi:hypothetical protein
MKLEEWPRHISYSLPSAIEIESVHICRNNLGDVNIKQKGEKGVRLPPSSISPAFSPWSRYMLSD